MIPFLKQVAAHYKDCEDLSGMCFIFPNRRSLVFFRKYLAEALTGSDRPCIAPAFVTVNDFFSSMAGETPADRVHLLLELYDCYKELNPKAEGLDEFIFWGDVLLGDFDDVDKYLVDARRIFTNVSDFKAIQDYGSYLSETQVNAIRQFVSHFSEGWSDDGKGVVKESFLRIWNLLAPLYLNFRSALRARGLSYEGMVYRDVAERLADTSVIDMLEERYPSRRRFVFVGLNALNECEKLLMKRMRDAGVAEFCWDWSSEAVKDPAGKASFFMRANVEMFPQAFVPDPEGLGRPVVNVLSVPSSIGQAKQLPEIFRRFKEGGASLGLDTAVVIPDETLLLPVLNSLPEEISKVNVTMGYPMSGCELWPLMNDIAGMQFHLRQKDGVWYFYHKQVHSIFSNGIFRACLDEDGRRKVEEIRAARQYYIPASSFAGDALMELVFQPVVTAPKASDAGAVRSFQRYQQDVLHAIALRLKDNASMSMELSFAKDFYQAIGRLMTRDLPVMPATYVRLLGRLMANAAVPYKGEPLQGLQIMGPLETRALDFSRLVVLSCNEGMFPRRSVSSSFIPPELRRGFELPTYEYQDAVWAYYFYRMIQRAGEVWLLFDSRPDVGRSGEESRYVKQIELLGYADVVRHVVEAPIRSAGPLPEIVKTPEMVGILHGKKLSASSLQSYLACPAKFYYSMVEGLSQPDEVSDSLDAGMLGNVLHKTMQQLYSVGGTVTVDYVSSLLAEGDPRVRDIVRQQIMDQMHSFEISGRNIIYEDMVLRYVRKILDRDLELMKERGSGSFRVIGLELKGKWKLGGYDFKGFIDRLDSFEDGVVRVVDYKTGKVLDDDFMVDEGNAAAVVSALFGPDNAKRPKIALQLYLYDEFVKEGEVLDPGDGYRPVSGLSDKRIQNSIYQTSRLFVEPVRNVELNDSFRGMMRERLTALLDEISDTAVPFRRTGDAKVCEYCDFKMLCGK